MLGLGKTMLSILIFLFVFFWLIFLLVILKAHSCKQYSRIFSSIDHKIPCSVLEYICYAFPHRIKILIRRCHKNNKKLLFFSNKNPTNSPILTLPSPFPFLFPILTFYSHSIAPSQTVMSQSTTPKPPPLPWYRLWPTKMASWLPISSKRKLF